MKKLADLLRSVDPEDDGYLGELAGRAKQAAVLGGMAGLEREIAGEIAYSLGRAEERIVTALARLAELAAELRAAPGDRRLLAAFDAERRNAERRVWELCVQREALGLRNEGVREQYPIPPRPLP